MNNNDKSGQPKKIIENYFTKYDDDGELEKIENGNFNSIQWYILKYRQKIIIENEQNKKIEMKFDSNQNLIYIS